MVTKAGRNLYTIGNVCSSWILWLDRTLSASCKECQRQDLRKTTSSVQWQRSGTGCNTESDSCSSHVTQVHTSSMGGTKPIFKDLPYSRKECERTWEWSGRWAWARAILAHVQNSVLNKCADRGQLVTHGHISARDALPTAHENIHSPVFSVNSRIFLWLSKNSIKWCYGTECARCVGYHCLDSVTFSTALLWRTWIITSWSITVFLHHDSSTSAKILHLS